MRKRARRMQKWNRAYLRPQEPIFRDLRPIWVGFSRNRTRTNDWWRLRRGLFSNLHSNTFRCFPHGIAVSERNSRVRSNSWSTQMIPGPLQQCLIRLGVYRNESHGENHSIGIIEEKTSTGNPIVPRELHQASVRSNTSQIDGWWPWQPSNQPVPFLHSSGELWSHSTTGIPSESRRSLDPDFGDQIFVESSFEGGSRSG